MLLKEAILQDPDDLDNDDFGDEEEDEEDGDEKMKIMKR